MVQGWSRLFGAFMMWSGNTLKIGGVVGGWGDIPTLSSTKLTHALYFVKCLMRMVHMYGQMGTSNREPVTGNCLNT